MGFWNKNKTQIKNEVKETVVDIKEDNVNNALVNFMNDSDDNDISLTEATVMQIPAVAGGVDLIANSIATLPVKLYKVNKEGEQEEIADDYRIRLLNVANNSFDSAYNMKYAQVKNLIIYGTCHTYLVKSNKNKIEALYYFNAKDVQEQLVKYGNGQYGYEYSFTLFNDFMNNVTQDQMMIAFKDCKQSTDVKGQGILDKGKKVLMLCLEELDTAEDNLNNRIPGYLSIEGSLSPQAKNNIRSTWKGLSNQGKLPVLEEGLKFNSVGLNSEQLELLDSRKYSTELVCQLMNIPFTYLLSSASSYNNSSQESLRFLKQALQPYIKVLEESYNKFLLSEKEIEQGFCFKFDSSEILRMSPGEYSDYVGGLYKSGMVRLNESRQMLNMPKIENGELVQLPVNCYFLDENGNIILPSMEYNIDNGDVVKKDKE